MRQISYRRQPASRGHRAKTRAWHLLSWLKSEVMQKLGGFHSYFVNENADKVKDQSLVSRIRPVIFGSMDAIAF